MATRTPTEQHIAEPEVPDVKDTLRIPLMPEQEVPQPQSERRVADRATAQPEEQGEKRSTSAAKNRAKTAALRVGVPILIALALILAGFMRTRIEHWLQRLVERAGDISVPTLLPVAIAETVREVIADRRAVGETIADPHAVT